MASKSHRSISFPAIGTGNKDLRKKVARVMSEAVTEFAKDTAKKLDVYFVIHQSQEDTFKVGFLNFFKNKNYHNSNQFMQRVLTKLK